MIALGALLASGWTACAAPLEAYGKLPNIEQAAVSPSGKLIAFIATNGDERSVVVQKAQDRTAVFVGPVGAARLRDITWAGDDHLILTIATAEQPSGVSGPRVEYHMASDLNLKTGRLHPLLAKVRNGGDILDSIDGFPIVRTVDGKPTVFVYGEHFISLQGQACLFRVDLDSGAATMIEAGGDGAYDWLIDERGKVVAEADYRDLNGEWKLKLRQASGSWLLAGRTKWLTGSPQLVGVSADGKSLVVAAGDEESGSSWGELSRESGAWSESSTNASGAEAIADPQTGRIIGKHALVGEEEQYTFFEPQDAAAWRAVTKAFPGDAVTLQSWSNDRKKIVVRVDSAQLGPAYALVDLISGHADWLGGEFIALTEDDIAQRTPVHYKAADGLEISGYLTLPRGREPHGLPLVVLPHGGPHDRDMPGFDWWSQALASRGYAVLQPNYRGSDGFGWSFLAAGFGQWGRKMQTDLSDGVRDLAAKGVVDPKRVCIVGASYGGYAALAGAAIDRGVYRCAVSVAGISNLKEMVSNDRDKEGRNGERFWLRYMGATGPRDPVLGQYSPSAWASMVEIPVLLIHGRDDTRVPISQSRQMADKLRAAGKSVELLELAGEDHFLSSGATRLQMLKATVAFLEKNNPPD